jgi:acyl carrier protein
MIESEILEKIKFIVAEQLSVESDTITLHSNFTNDLGADELSIVGLAMGLEEEFDIEIPDEIWEKISTVQEAFGLYFTFQSCRI